LPARRLLVRTVAAAAGNDQARLAETPRLLREFRALNAAGPDGRTFDFVQRDALHYHIAAVQPLVELILSVPGPVDGQVRAAVLAGLEFLRPYSAGEREHVEFARTSVAFDRERRDAGDPEFQNAPWRPERGRVLLRLARAAFPEVRPWTEHVVDSSYDPRVKLLAAVHGEPRSRAEWPG
jgi:hypothetical protein